ncbi:MAG: ACP phosphodiesterase [Gammaproteobacteria bacterium]|nr:ACP phosphodiesterase [Gammaproteobacteria bacterium]
MNYLAHAFLGRATPELLTGSMLGDFVKGRLDDRYPPEVRAGIALHRAIDGFTDSHARVQASRALIAPERRRFAGILVDVFHDHFLARHWSRFSSTPLERFTAEVYGTLWPQRHGFPERLQRMLPWMRADDWLASYADVDAVDASLRGMSRRFRFAERAQPLASGVEELNAHYAELEQLFLEFFPELERYATMKRDAHISDRE